MDSSDEGETGNYRSSHLLFSFFLIVLLAACTPGQRKQPAPVTPPAPPVTAQKTDTTQPDSSVAPARTVKKIYLTFDDGPNKGTLHVLRILQQKGIRASFFIVGKHVYDSPQQSAAWDTLRMDTMMDRCNHSYTHANNRYSKFYSNPEGVVADIQQAAGQPGFTNRVVRMPGRNAWRIGKIRVTDIRESKRAIDSVAAAGFDVMGWDIEWMFDHRTLAPDTATSLLLRRIRNMLDAGTTRTPGHLVLLAHDQVFYNAASQQLLLDFLAALQENSDYEFVVASRYPGLRTYPTAKPDSAR